MNKLGEVIEMIMGRYKEENGEDLKLEEGDEIASVFNDGVVILGVEDNTFKMKVLAGEPYVFNYDLDLIER